MTRMVIILCLSLMRQSFSAATSTTLNGNTTQLDWIHSSTNASYKHVSTTTTHHSNLANQTTEGQLQTERTQLIWIVIATILSSTIVITLGISLGIKIYFERQSVPRQPEAYFNGLVMTNAVFIPITANCIPTDYKGDIFPVLWENCATSVNY